MESELALGWELVWVSELQLQLQLQLVLQSLLVLQWELAQHSARSGLPIPQCSAG